MRSSQRGGCRRTTVQRGRRKLHPVYVVERRLALEWMIRRDDWDDVALDT